MANSNKGSDHGSYEGDSSLPVASGPINPPTYPTLVAKETMPVERGIPFNKHIMIGELHTHFRAPSFLLAYDDTTDPVEHIYKFENATLLHSTSSLATRNTVNQPSAIFGIKQEENEILRAYVQCFNMAILEVPIVHQEVLVSTFTQALHRGPLFKSLAKKLATYIL
ncbi:hypothetical protein Sango_1908700 [Sesamum angolense]|uniref:Uncharacterized protein n=1 Tax=Sesamum angolense TaxID=2727404 RepID=A0AAE1WJJ6_9LAMI|nr:hypothetical protein Sango_1908700 [Sesamum angolense]